MCSTSGACSSFANASTSVWPEPARIVRNNPTLRTRPSTFESASRPADAAMKRQAYQQAAAAVKSEAVCQAQPNLPRRIDHVVVGQAAQIVRRGPLIGGHQALLLVH